MEPKWTPNIAGRPGPRYLAIADEMAAAIAAGRLKPGRRLPTHRELARRLDVTIGTVTRAYAEAERRGLVAGEVGRGTFVREPVEDTKGTLFRSPAAATPAFVDLARNRPTLEGPAAGCLARHLARLATEDLRPLLGYVEGGGSPAAHREAGAAWIARRGIAADPGRVACVAGALNGLSLALAALTRPGDVLLTESLTFYAVRASAALAGVRLVGVPMDGEGLLPDALEAACRQHAPKALYAMPVFQNPTGARMSAARRAEIVATCRHHGVTVVEDDILGFLDESAPTICAEAPDIVVLLTSLSKSVAPGLRAGFVHAAAPAARRIAAAQQASLHTYPPLASELAARMIGSGDAAVCAEWHRQLARRRHAAARAALDGVADLAAPETGGGVPNQLWIRLPPPWRAEAFAAAARARNVGVAPAASFAIPPAPPPEAVRVSLAICDHDVQLAGALRVISGLLLEGPAAA